MSMRWQDYELAVLEHLRQEYAGLPVRVFGTEGGQRHEVVGQYSMVPRQLDVAAYAEGDERPFFVADAKHYSEKLDVKDVESFAGMADDVGARFSALIAPEGFTAGAFRRAAAVEMDLQLLTVDEALTCSWLGHARMLYPQDWVFRRETALALRRVSEGAEDEEIVEALEALPFEEWTEVVGFALLHHRSPALRMLVAVADHHPDDTWRFNAVDRLIDAGEMGAALRARLLASESDPDVRELLLG